MQEVLTIVKIGGNVINDEPVLAKVLQDFKDLKEKKILIHGGGKKASELMRRMGMQPTMIEGRRVTDAATLEIVTMVYAGLINKNIVAQLQAMDCDAIGMSGADLNALQSHKRIVKEIDYGWVGDIDKVNGLAINRLLNAQFTPVFCAITHDKKGQLLNTNADSIAANIAAGMSSYFSTRLILCFEKEGVLSDPTDDTSVIPTISYKEFQHYKASGVISAGMIPKMEGAFFAMQHGVQNVYIAGIHALENRIVKGTELCL